MVWARESRPGRHLAASLPGRRTIRMVASVAAEGIRPAFRKIAAQPARRGAFPDRVVGTIVARVIARDGPARSRGNRNGDTEPDEPRRGGRAVTI